VAKPDHFSASPADHPQLMCPLKVFRIESPYYRSYLLSLSGSMEDLMIAQQDAHMRDPSSSLSKKSQVSFRTSAEIPPMPLARLLPGITQ